MARARNIKPSFFLNEDLVTLPFEVRLLFIGLWTIADRDGKFEDRPARIKMELFPADNIDVNAGLQSLHDLGFILRYEVDGIRCCKVLKWDKHQAPHVREKASALPDPEQSTAKVVHEQCQGSDKASPRFPDSLNPDSLNPVPEEYTVSGVDARACDGDAPLDSIPENLSPPATTRRGYVCRLLRQAGVTDAAPHHLDDETWSRILAQRTDEEITEFARAKIASNPGKRLNLRYLAPGLLEQPKPISTPPARASPYANARENGRLAAARTIFGTAIEGENHATDIDDDRTIDATPSA